MRQTSWPTTASASRHSPTRRIPAAKAQWTISACGNIALLEVGEERFRHDDREHDPRECDEQGRLDQQPPEALAAWMQQRHAVRLKDRPNQPCGDRRRADERDRPGTPTPYGFSRQTTNDRCFHLHLLRMQAGRDIPRALGLVRGSGGQRRGPALEGETEAAPGRRSVVRRAGMTLRWPQPRAKQLAAA